MRMRAAIALLIFGLLAGLLVVEAVPRVFARLMPKEFQGLQRVYAGRAKWQEIMVPDGYLGYRPKPDLDVLFPSEGRSIPVRTTSHGLGDIGFRDIGTRAPFDAIALGDSFAFCDDVPVDSCWVRRIADLTGLSVATLGVSGYSTLAEARILERYGLPLHPRIVLQGLFPNDFNDNLDFDQWSRSGAADFWSWRASKEGRGVVGGWLAAHSMAFRLAEATLRGGGEKTYHYQRDGLDLVFRVDRWWLPEGGNRAEDRRRGWELMQQALLSERASAQRSGAQLVVVLIPAKEEVYWDLVRAHAPASEEAAADHPLQIVQAFCEANGIAFCDLAPALETAARQDHQVYLKVSGHWNDEGNAIAARTVAACLADTGLLDRHVAGAATAAVPH
jgi:acetyltransferase AlgX (SGNH hydrolase-like protein)